MAGFLPLVNVTDALRHALDVIRQEIERQLASLNTKEQNEFWTELHGYALARSRGEQRPPLVASTGVERPVRQALEIIDAHIRKHTAELGDSDRQRFWEVLHEQAQRMADQAGRS
jgi:hypothetical protein